MLCPVCVGAAFKPYCSKNGFLLSRCRACGFLMAEIRNLDLAEYYNNPRYLHDDQGTGGYVNYEIDKSPMFPIYVSLLQKISAIVPGKRLLDIGSASGYFLNVAAQMGYRAEGIDLNPLAVAEGKKLGRNIIQGDFPDISYDPASFDVVTAFDLFEHLPPDRINLYAATVSKILKPGGILAIITVNTNSLWARLLGHNWHALIPPEHISYFNISNMEKFLSNHGFRIIESRTLHKKFSLQYIFNSLYRWQHLSAWKHITSFLGKHSKIGTLSLWLPIGDNMLVIAKKHE